MARQSGPDAQRLAADVYTARQFLGRAAVVVQVALSLVLLVGTMLTLRSLHNLLTTDSGFASTNVLVTAVSCQQRCSQTAGSSPGRVVESFEAVASQVSQMPGVEAAGLVNHLPLSESTALARGSRLNGGSRGLRRSRLRVIV